MKPLSYYSANPMPSPVSGDDGIQRYRVPAQHIISLQLAAGSTLTLSDPEGEQEVQLIAFDSDGKPALESLGAAANSDIAPLRNWMDANDQTSCQGISIFGARSKALSKQSYSIANDVLCLIAAPGEDMSQEQRLPPTDIIVGVSGNGVIVNDELPAPLGPVDRDIRINNSTAQAYLVKAGEYIQIIDVAGRQCSDFIALDAARLAQGVEKLICPLTTRTLMASAFPGPGLYDKFYTDDQVNVLNVIQDTVARHDTFNLACSAKYYDDIGYPGHINCTENLNAVLGQMGVAPRKGWPAVNFFFNTGYDDYDQHSSCQPWTRPGDYVLMQAQVDLVCGSTACPDDISPANGWNPTDIHVRIYAADNNFEKGNAFRKNAVADSTMTKKTAFHDRFATMTQHFVDYNGYWLANHFSNYGAIAEYWACREKVVLMDLSPLRKCEVLGPDAENLLNYAVTRNIRKLAIGQVIYTAMCYPNGCMVDDGTVFRLGTDNFRWVGGCDGAIEWLRKVAIEKNFAVVIKDSNDQLHNLPVQGPLSCDTLKKVIFTPDCQTSIEDLRPFRITHGRIGGPQGAPVTVSRTGYTGERGYEVWCHPKDGHEVWDAVWDAGQEFGISPLGLEALDNLRIESALIFADYEFNDQTDPFEAGIGFTVPLKTKDEDFIGRDALIERKANPQRQLVGLVLEGEEIASHGECVRVGRQQVGTITSAVRSPILNQNIALCSMSIDHIEPGTQVEVGKLDGHIKRIPATVVGISHYDPTKSRVRA